MSDDLFEPDAPNYSGASFPPLREFQITSHEKLREGARAGHKNQVVMAPTGGGKAILGMKVIHEALLRGKRAIFVCDRNTLVDQAASVADGLGISEFGIIQANHWRYAPSKLFQICSAQTLMRRQFPENIDVAVFDECHVMYAACTDYILNSKARCVGLTATAFTAGMGKVYTNLINATTMHELIESGVLVPFRVFECTRIDMKGAATHGGEWTEKASEERGLQIVGDVVLEWQKYGEGRKTICFGSTIKHCEEICRQFNEAGIMAAVFCADTPDTERARLLEEYRKPDSVLRVLVSVSALSRGFDVPDVGCVIDCRPLRKSLSEFMQMIGRGLRSSPSTGKLDCVILSHSGNFERFKEDFEEVYYNGLASLDMGEKLDKKVRKDEDDKEVRSCPKCGFSPFAKRCISCGYEKTSSALIEHQPGEMREVMLGKRKAADNHRDLWNQVVTYHRNHGDPKTLYGRASHTFKSFVGDFQPKHWRIEEVPDGIEVNAVVRGKIRSNFIRYAKATGR